MVEKEEVSVSLIEDAVTFSEIFVDKCHHGKEESCFFPCLEKKGITRAHGPIGVMLVEHEMGRRLVAKIKEATGRLENGRGDKWEVITLCREYVGLLEGHIFKEENLLFQMASQIMVEKDEEDTVECYDRTELERVGGVLHKRMVKLAEKLEPKP